MGLSLGEDWVAGVRTAGRLWRLDDCNSNFVEFIGTGHQRKRAGAITHRTLWLPKSHRSKVGGILTTSPTRTILDLGCVVSLNALEVALESALRSGLTSVDYLQRQLGEFRTRGRRGCAAMVELLALRQGLKTTESAFETKLFQVLRRGGLPLPQRQIPVYENGVFIARPDFLYPSTKVALEALSRRHHAGYFPGEADAARRNRLVAAGYAVLEISYRQLQDTPHIVIEDVAKALHARLF